MFEEGEVNALLQGGGGGSVPDLASTPQLSNTL